MYKDIGGYDMKYDEFTEMCHKAWSERYNYLCTDMTKKMKLNIVFSMKAKTHLLNAIPKVNLFNKIFPIKDRIELEKLNKLVSLQNQVKGVRLQDKLGKQNFHENIKKLFEPVTDTIKNTSENLTKTIADIYIKNKKPTENLNDKVLDLMNDKSMIAPYLASS